VLSAGGVQGLVLEGKYPVDVSGSNSQVQPPSVLEQGSSISIVTMLWAG
jgi:hypothetical protein